MATRPPWDLAVARTDSSAPSSSCPRLVSGRPASGDGDGLTSRLNRSSSRVRRGSPASSRMAWFLVRGWPWSSIRNSSSSAPMVRGPSPNPGRSSSCSSASRQWSSRSVKRA